MLDSHPLLWLAWAAFGSCAAWLVLRRLLPAALRGGAPGALAPAPPPPGRARGAAVARPAWLYCEEGTTLERRVAWFPLRQGGHTVLGRRPRPPSPEALYVYLSAEDLRPEHAIIRFDPQLNRYVLENPGDALVVHNNEPLPPDACAPLADGDTLELGRLSRFRFTHTGPEGA